MGIFGGSAARQAAASSATAAVDAVDLVNQPTGAGVASPIWSGPVNPQTYANPGDLTKSQELTGALPGQQFTETLPHTAPGGGYQDTSWTTGHDAPMAPWDAQQVQGIGPGAIIDTHGWDEGAVYQAEHVTPPAIGNLRRITTHGEAMDLVWGFDPVTGERDNAPAGRSNMDQTQTNDYAGFDPVMVGYSERAIYNNLAFEAQAYSGTGVYSPSGALPAISVGNDYAAQTYQAPPDPATSTAVPAPAASIGGGWVLG